VSEAAADFEEVSRTGSGEQQIAAREGRARCLLAQGEPSRAASLLSSAEDAPSLVTLGAARYALKDWAGAKEAFEKAAVADPMSAAAMNGLGFVKAQNASAWADIDAALETLTKARGLDPLNYFWPPLGKGFAEQRKGSKGFTASVDHYERAAAALPTDPYVHYILGYSYLRDGRLDDALKKFQAALDLDYRFVDALIGAGTAALQKEDWAAARGFLKRALTLETRNYEESGGDESREALVLLNYRLGRTYILSTDLPEGNRLKDAQAHFSVILESKLDPNCVPALEALAYISYMLGDSEMAKQYFDQASDLAPEGSPVRAYADEQKAKIIDAESRARWSDAFDRPDSSKVGNEWGQTNQGAMTPMIRGEEVVVEGRAQESSPIWLTRSGRKWDLLKNFISARTTVELKKNDDLNFRVFVFTRKGDGTVSSAAGVERNARGNVSLISWKANTNGWERELLKDEAGAPMMWPEGRVEVEIVRTDPKKGVFAFFLSGQRIGEVKLGLRARSGALDLGFQFQAARGVAYRAAVDDVQIELYR
jgi:tetratricopeptide (TPR) repeat protein